MQVGHSWFGRRGSSSRGNRRGSRMGVRYLLSALVVAAYAAYMVHKYGIKDGLIATYITWSFFVLGTPVADAGGILDVPLRVLTGFPMVAIEMCVIAFTIASMVLLVKTHPEAFERTGLLRAFKTMLTTPYPYWGIIALCVVGTIMSVRLGDILIDNIGAAFASRSVSALYALPLEFWLVVAAYAVVWWIYVAGMFPLMAPLLRTGNVYAVLF